MTYHLRDDMQQFYGPLIGDMVDLALRQYTNATKGGHHPNYFVLCGGPAQNKWVHNKVFASIRCNISNIQYVAIQE